MRTKKEFGDFQTPEPLVREVAALVAQIYGTPELAIEPTCGLGAFLRAAESQWNCRCEGYEINSDYFEKARETLSSANTTLFLRDFFSEDWKKTLNRDGISKVLVIGNPPWVTNSALSSLQSKNLPKKNNFQGLRGIEAQTGKSNFDISEWMLIQLIEALQQDGGLAMLCKTMTARKVLRHFWKKEISREKAFIFHIDAKAHFNVAVDACLFIFTGKPDTKSTATVFSKLSLSAPSRQIGYQDCNLVSDMAAFIRTKKFDGGTNLYTWRSGIKHDAASVMEFEYDGKHLVNGVGAAVDIENDFLYPLLKSSDIANNRIEARKYVLVTQQKPNEDTTFIKISAPRTWRYLENNREAFDRRKSVIYKDKPKFCMFGIGAYSFSPWKVAISGLYKTLQFAVISPFFNRPVMLDDTCYSISCNSQDEAIFLHKLLSSEPAIEFFSSLIFIDSKRPITLDLLQRLSLVEIARYLGCLSESEKFFHFRNERNDPQLMLLMETPQTAIEYLWNKKTGSLSSY